jgi:4-hydroxybenzoate polyprenyltransferase
VKNIFTALRLPECSLVVFLSFLSFKISNTPISFLLLISLFFITASTMLQNGWRDRQHDIKKGKTIHKEKPSFFILWLFIFWLTSSLLSVSVFYSQHLTGCILFAMIAVGLLYSEARHIPFLSIFLVTITVASVTLLPMGFSATGRELLPLFLVVIFLMFGRENLHDIADMTADTSYKKTIPIIFGDYTARIISVITLIIGSIIALVINPVSIFGSVFILLGILQIPKEQNLIKVRQKIDTGLVLITLSFLIIYF